MGEKHNLENTTEFPATSVMVGAILSKWQQILNNRNTKQGQLTNNIQRSKKIWPTSWVCLTSNPPSHLSNPSFSKWCQTRLQRTDVGLPTWCDIVMELWPDYSNVETQITSVTRPIKGKRQTGRLRFWHVSSDQNKRSR